MSYELKGADALMKKLKKAAELKDVKNAVKINGAELTRRMVINASFTQGYQTGTTKRSIIPVLSPDGLSVTVAPSTEYSPYLEYGTRFMSAQPFIGPAYYAQKPIFLKDLMRLVE